MKNYFNRIFKYTIPYKKFFLLNIFANIFYALFGTLSMISLFPMLKVLFNQTESLATKPVWIGIGDICYEFLTKFFHLEFLGPY